MSIQAQVMNLLLHLQQEKGLSYIFIAHDLSMVRYISDTVAVMYLGSIMEYAGNRELYEHPQHPYTKALFSGCKFCTRCGGAKPVCFEQAPPLRECAPGHLVACHCING